MNQKEKLLNIKNQLSELKTNLSYILKEKNTNKNYLENNINKIKYELQNTIQKNKKNDSKSGDNNNDYYLETEAKEKNYEGNELSKLKLQNFKIENEIKKAEFMILNYQNSLNLSKITNLIEEEHRDIFLFNINDNNKENEIDTIMNSLILEERDLLNKYESLNKQQLNYIEQYKKEINRLKQEIKSESLISPKDIILENSFEENTVGNNIFSDNKKNLNFNNNIDSNGAKNNVNISSTNDNSKDIKNNIKNLNNIVNLRMSFNFNINIGEIKNV